jgi:hypothetical protein
MQGKRCGPAWDLRRLVEEVQGCHDGIEVVLKHLKGRERVGRRDGCHGVGRWAAKKSGAGGGSRRAGELSIEPGAGQGAGCERYQRISWASLTVAP